MHVYLTLGFEMKISSAKRIKPNFGILDNHLDSHHIKTQSARKSKLQKNFEEKSDVVFGGMKSFVLAAKCFDLISKLKLWVHKIMKYDF